MLRSGLCNYSDAYIVTKETITVEGDNNDKARNKKLMLKNNNAIENDDDGNKINKNKTMTNKSFEYKVKLIGRPENDNIVPFKYLSSFWRFLNLPWIISKIELDLSWSKECIMSITPEVMQWQQYKQLEQHFK